jgi:hypothetical protein
MKRLFDKVAGLVLTLRTQSDRKKLINGLQQQRFLLRTGMQAVADVVEIQKKGIKINNLVEIKLVLSIHRSNGQIMLAESYSIVNIDKIPFQGQKLKIWFIPQDTSYILIL